MGELAESRGDLGQRHSLSSSNAFGGICIPMGLAASLQRNLSSCCSLEKGAAPHSQVLNQDLCLLLTNQLQLRGGCAECEMRWGEISRQMRWIKPAAKGSLD